MIRICLIAFILSGCTVALRDDRLTREALHAAFAERDQAITILVQKVESLEQKIVTKK